VWGSGPEPILVNGADAQASKEATMMKCKGMLAILIVGSGFLEVVPTR
jgi:hypothetical protein